MWAAAFALALWPLGDNAAGRYVSAWVATTATFRRHRLAHTPLEWEILRWRRLKSSLMRTRGLEALEQFLDKHLDYYDHYRKYFEQNLTEILQDNLADGQTEVDAQSLVHKCAENEQDAVGKVNQILDGINLDMDEILNGARARKAKEI